MCGRYALGIRAAFVRHQLQQQGLALDNDVDGGSGYDAYDAGDGNNADNARETYNFAPGYRGIVCRANVPDRGAGAQDLSSLDQDHDGARSGAGEGQDASGGSSAVGMADEEEEGRRGEGAEMDQGESERRAEEALLKMTTTTTTAMETKKKTTYRLQAMRWGLIPFWTKRNPQYASMLKTINARDDSLAANSGMWTTMKRGKRCIVIAQGFYEWLKPNGGKGKVPHYVKRKDGLLMCFAGLWDCVQYEGSDEKIYTYTIITTDSNAQLKFLHDRMPVILDAGSENMRIWLDPQRREWTRELQALLRPYDGALDCYAVSGAVGKVGNDSRDFVVPVASAANRSNIANFFAHGDASKKTVDVPRSEDNAPMPVEAIQDHDQASQGLKRSRVKSPSEDEKPSIESNMPSPKKILKSTVSHASQSPSKPSKAMRSSTTNGTKASPLKAAPGSQRITDFFGK